jgi:hypothetical protein
MFGALGKLLVLVKSIPQMIGLVEKVATMTEKAKLAGPDKHDMVVEMVREMIEAGEGLAGKDIMDQNLFSQALDELIHAIVKMMNATVWYKKG